MEVGLGPGHIVLDGDPAPPNGKKHSSPPTFAVYERRQAYVRPYKPHTISIVREPNGWMDQDVIRYGGT